MDKLIPIGVLLIVTIIGCLSQRSELVHIRNRYDFTFKYHNKFIDFLEELFEKRSFNNQSYYELTKNVNKMQRELGADGICDYIQDNLKGFRTHNYQLLINFLPETCNVLNNFDNLIMRERYLEEAQNCDNMFIRHLGSLEDIEKDIKKSICNPFTDFAEGVRWIISSPASLLEWFKFISEEKGKKFKKNPFLKIIHFIVTIVSFVSGIMAIVMGWNDFLELIKSFIG